MKLKIIVEESEIFELDSWNTDVSGNKSSDDTKKYFHTRDNLLSAIKDMLLNKNYEDVGFAVDTLDGGYIAELRMDGKLTGYYYVNPDKEICIQAIKDLVKESIDTIEVI